jgi:hypothetical protein
MSEKAMTPDELWENGVEHYEESYQLIKLVNKVSPELDLELGGDGDIGENIAYALDYLINTCKVKIEIL